MLPSLQQPLSHRRPSIIDFRLILNGFSGLCRNPYCISTLTTGAACTRCCPCCPPSVIHTTDLVGKRLTGDTNTIFFRLRSKRATPNRDLVSYKADVTGSSHDTNPTLRCTYTRSTAGDGARLRWLRIETPKVSLSLNLCGVQATLLRVNDELDADARATISDAERYLRGPTAPPQSNNDHSSHPGATAANGHAQRRKITNSNNCWNASVSSRRGANGHLRDSAANRTVPTNGGLSAGRDARRAAGGANAEIVNRTSNHPRAAGNGAGHGRDAEGGGFVEIGGARRGGEEGGDVGVSASPLFRWSEKVKDAARASAERSGRRPNSASSGSPRPDTDDYAVSKPQLLTF